MPRCTPAKALETISVLPMAVAGRAAPLSVILAAGLLLRLSNP